LTLALINIWTIPNLREISNYLLIGSVVGSFIQSLINPLMGMDE